MLSHGAPVEAKHGVRTLFEEYGKRQLLNSNKHSKLCTLVVFLGGLRDNDKEDHGVGYRYASRNGLVPTLEWVREDVATLITEIKTRLENWAEANVSTNQVTRFRYGISKPAAPKPRE